MDDQTSLYLRVASTEAVSSIREKLLDTIGMTKELTGGSPADVILARFGGRIWPSYGQG